MSSVTNYMTSLRPPVTAPTRRFILPASFVEVTKCPRAQVIASFVAAFETGIVYSDPHAGDSETRNSQRFNNVLYTLQASCGKDYDCTCGACPRSVRVAMGDHLSRRFGGETTGVEYALEKLRECQAALSHERRRVAELEGMIVIMQQAAVPPTTMDA